MSKGFPVSKLPVGFSLEKLAYTAIAIGIMLRFLNLGSREFWYDEVLSLLVSAANGSGYRGLGAVPVALHEYTALLSLPLQASIGETIENIRNVLKGLVADVHPPLSFLGLNLWLRLFGNSEAALRSLPALISVAAIGGAYGLGRVILRHRGGLILAALLATNPYYLFHSLNIRMYAGLVLWTTLSAWAMLQLMSMGRVGERESGRAGEWESGRVGERKNLFTQNSSILWTVLLIGSVASGLLTQYLFAYWVITLGIFVLIFDRHRWWQHGLRLGTSVILTVPWILWGTRQQLRNRPNLGGQFDRAGGLEHLNDVAQTLGTHLLLGDWVTSLPITIATTTGCVVILLLVACTINLWRQGERRTLLMVLVMGILPLLLALTADILTGKFTVGFGEGRTMIFILPGCLLLIALWLERAAGKWRGILVSVLLLLYLSISIGDFTIRQRSMFHQLANLIQQEPTTPTLVAMNTRAWGNVLRLAYYIPPTAPVMLFAQDPAKLAPTLEKVLAGKEAVAYPRLIWLDYANPVWGRLKTETEKETEKQKIQKLLNARFQRTSTQQLSGTMNIDRFSVNLYKSSDSK